MQEAKTVHRVGEAVITKIPEIPLDGVDASVLYPASTPDLIAEAGQMFGPGSFDPQTGQIRESIHAWLVQTPGRVILIDTATGNGKNRPYAPVMDHLHQPFLSRLEAAGVRSADVDLVLHTHLHADHVGWNTTKLDGRWVPTFPNAQHVFSGLERAYNAALFTGEGSPDGIRAEAARGPMSRTPHPGVFEDSVLPVIEAGLSREIAVDGSEAVEGFSFLPSPGHSIDHACISFTSRGERALFWGDVLHHPLQASFPDWNSVYCEFPEAALRSRRWALNHAADTGALVFTTHFAESSAGRVYRDGDHFRWEFACRGSNS